MAAVVALSAATSGLVFTSQPADAAVVRGFAPRFQANDNGDFIVAGNTLVTCTVPLDPSDPPCPQAVQHGPVVNNNDYHSRFVDVDGVLSTANSSHATLTVPDGASVLWAGLYWMGSTASSDDSNRASILLAPPDQDYTVVYGQVSTSPVVREGRFAYSGFADVTPLVQSAGSYTVGGLTAALGIHGFGGWAIVAAIRDPAQPLRNLAVFDGYADIDGDTMSPVTTTLAGFVAPPSGPVTARIGVIASEGDLAPATGDSLEFNGHPLSDGPNPSTNFFNSSITRLGARVTDKNPDFVHQLGLDLDYVVAPDGAISNGQTEAPVTFTTGGESYEVMAMFTAINI
jgi:hypothetical protein